MNKNKKVSKSAFEKWKMRVSLVQNTNFESFEKSEERIKKARKDYNFFVKTYFPHLATAPCGKFHISTANYLLKNPNARKVAKWARGHAKSSHISLMIPLWLKIQEKRQINLMLLASKSEDMAKRLLGDLQAELEFNKLFIADFGTQIKQGSWAEGEFKTEDGTLFIALGRGQSPRGIKDRGQRPDYIVIDDIDDDELIENPKRTKKVTDWCLSALIGTMAMGRGRFVIVGNLIGKDSVLAQISSNKAFYTTQVDALDKNGLPSWAENYTIEEINSLRLTIGERRFQKEYMNNPINEGTVFSAQHIRYTKILPLKEYNSLICYTDPSFKNSNTADFKATMLVGKTKKGEFHIIKAFVEQTSVSRLVEWHYQIADWIDGKVPVRYFMESNFLQDLLLDEFRKEGQSKGLHIPVTGDNRKKPDKFARIEALQPLFERGLIKINEAEKHSEGILNLIEQLLMFEKGSRSHDDAPDALEGAIFLLSKRIASGNKIYSFGARESRKY